MKKGLLKKVISTLISICLMVAVANIPAYAKVNAISATKTTDAVLTQTYYTPAQLAKQTLQTLQTSSPESISVEDEQVKEIQKGKDSNGQDKYYAVISDGTKYINVEIPDNLYQYIENGKISKENVTITINQAEPKESINGNSVISNADAQITINITTEAINALNKDQVPTAITVENSKTDVSKQLTKTTPGAGTVSKPTLEVTTAYLKKLANKGKDLIKNLLKNLWLSGSVIDKLNSEKSLINSILKSKSKSTEKEKQLKNRIKSINAISNMIKKVAPKYKYTSKEIKVLKALANKFSLKLETVKNSFLKMGVTKFQINKVSSTLLKLIKRGVIFANCASLAVSKYLGISRNLAALQNLAAEISIDPNTINSYKNEKVIIGTGGGAELKTLQKNGHKYAEYASVTLTKLMANLQPGEKAVVHVSCYNKQGKVVTGHAITIGKEKDGKYAVYDTLINGGNKVIYTDKEFKKFMNGQSAKGKTASGKSITKPVYYTNTTSGIIRYKMINNGEISIKTDAKKLPGELRESYNKNISLINKLLKTKAISSLAKKWLNGAKTLLSQTFNGNKDYYEKRKFFNHTEIVLQEIEIQNLSTQSLIKQSSSKAIFGYNVFLPLTSSVLKKDIAYKIYTKYDNAGIEVIEALSKKFNLSQTVIYNQFIKNKLTKDEMKYLSYFKADIEAKGKDYLYTVEFWSDANIGKNLAAIKNLAKK